MLEVKNIFKSYGQKQALKDINISFAQGESTVLIGESGSGKTTLAKIIIGMETPDKGEVIFQGNQLKSLSKRKFDICSKIQYIFQDPYSALENNYTVRKTLEEPIKIAKRNKAEHLTVNEALSTVDERLLEYLEQSVSVLSGGQRQKLCIARALITKPSLIIADECCAMLDNDSSKEINKLLNQLKINIGLSLIYIAHEVDFENDQWDKIAVFKDGHIVEQGEFESFLNLAKEDYSKSLMEAYYFFKR